MLIIVLTSTFFTWNGVTASELYHTDLKELEFSSNPYYNNTIISQHKILYVPGLLVCKTSTCLTNDDLAKAFHEACFKNECNYTEYYCLQDSYHSVSFCAQFDECNPNTRLVGKINETFPDYIDIYAVACPDGYVQPNIKHGCFSLCVVDNSNSHLPDHPVVVDEINLTTRRPKVSSEDNPNEKEPIDDHLPDHQDATDIATSISVDPKANTNEKEPVLVDTQDQVNDDDDALPKEDDRDGVTLDTPNKGTSESSADDINRTIGISVAVILSAILIVSVLSLLWKIFKTRRSSQGGQNVQPIKRDTRIHNSINKVKNILNLENSHDVVINVRQTEALLFSSSQGDFRAESQDVTTTGRNSDVEQRMNDLKDVDLEQVTTEGERGNGDGQSFYNSNTLVKQIAE